MNSELRKLYGVPNNASDGKLTRSDNEAARRPETVDLGMGTFSPHGGDQPNYSKYIVNGVNAGKGVGGKRSILRSAGESR